jgi:hypothetical protein
MRSGGHLLGWWWHVRGRTVPLVVALVVVGLALWFVARWQLSRPLASEAALVALQALGPASVGAAVGVSAVDELAELSLPGRPRRVLRSVPVALVLLCGLLALAPFAMLGGAEFGVASAARNVLGFAGLGLIGSSFLGVAGGAAVPIVGAFLELTAGRSAGVTADWAWPLLPASDVQAAVLAGALAVAGMASAAANAVAPLGRAARLG